jgi:hypothetical protein
MPELALAAWPRSKAYMVPDSLWMPIAATDEPMPPWGKVGIWALGPVEVLVAPVLELTQANWEVFSTLQITPHQSRRAGAAWAGSADNNKPIPAIMVLDRSKEPERRWNWEEIDGIDGRKNCMAQD